MYGGVEPMTAVQELPVAKKRAEPPESVPTPSNESERQPVVLTMRGKPEWKIWLKKLSRHCHLKVAVCVEQALMEYANRRGFDEPPPERTS
jgi:hypothetical protein